jgi:hypothetical protein
MTTLPLLVALVAASLHADESSLHRTLDWDTWSGGERDFHVVADSLGDGWSLLSLPVWGQDTLPGEVDARYVLVRPDGTFANHASTRKRGAALVDTGMGLCASDGLRQAIASWMDCVGRAGLLESPFAVPPGDVRPWGSVGSTRELRGTGIGDVRICLVDLEIPWRSETDSGTARHHTGFVVAWRDGAWRLAVEGMENNPAGRSWLVSADSAVRGMRRGAPDLDAFWPLLLRGGWSRTGRGFLQDPWRVDRVGSDWVACLDPIWNLGGDCLRWKKDGSLVGTPRLRALRGWRGCLGIGCVPLDTSMITDFAKEILSGIRTAEETARENGGPLPRTLSEVWTGAPDPVFAIRWAPPKMERDGFHMARFPLSLCLKKDSRSCLAEDSSGCFEGTGIFRSARGRVRRYELDQGQCGGL